MPRQPILSDLVAFLAVARERSFTRAAAQLGVSQSALSHTIRGLEERLGIRLLTRTTRAVAPTEAGERLLNSIGPRLDEIDSELAAVTALSGKPAGTVRITTGEHAATTILWPKLREVLPDYPDITVEVIVDYGLTDIVAERYDAGIRLGEHLAKDMIAVRIGPELRLIVVGSPAYFASHPAPATPHDLVAHRCINTRLPTYGGLYAWEFEKDGQELKVRGEGQLVFNSTPQGLQAALDGFGLAFVMEDTARALIEAGRLVQVLDDWCTPFSGYHFYYPSRRQASPALRVLAEALRYRG
ncbi:LysR family transcriptional regulator [Pleomorphomonas oryzae]|uniref:LysR family transcriptional regulator n=1 Tax=Pleomorphomonas oryzae TaxID=261934 RepID=UPI00040B93FB|nr:LysR family transcriptional regulator [Pleomorphomonas oryzae]